MAKTDHPVRVLHSIHSLAGGGAEKQLLMLAAHSREQGIEAAIFCVDPGPVEAGDLPCPTYTAIAAGRMDPRTLSRLRESIADFRPDVLHTWLPARITIPSLIAARLAGVPVVYSYRNAMQFVAWRRVPEFLAMSLLATTIVTNNPVAQSHWLYRWAYRRKQGKQIDNGIEAGWSAPPNLWAVPGHPVVMFAARIARQKNWRGLIEGFRLFRQHSDGELWICGTGEDADELGLLVAARGLQDDVKVLGYRADVAQLMRQADIFVLPSFYEGTPNVALEACAVGLPLALSAIPAHQSFIAADAAWHFDPTDPQSLAACLLNMLGDPDAVARRRAAGLAFVAERTPARMAASYARVYRGLAGRQSR